MRKSIDRLEPARLKGHFPFRLGTTSYIIPDEIEPNVRALAPWVDDIELVLFESEEISNLPSPGAIAALAALAAGNQLTYTVHFPLDIQLGAADEEIRRASVAQCLRVFQLTEPLGPHAWVLHFHGERRGQQPAEDVDAWCCRLDRSAAELLAGGMPPERLAVETLDYPFALVWPIVQRRGLGVCVDVGHLILGGRDPVRALDAYRDRCRVVHLHGVRDGRDHVDAAALDRTMLQELYRQLRRPGGAPCVVTLEVFNQQDFERSLEILEEVWR